MPRSTSRRAGRVRFHFSGEAVAGLRRLPWDRPLEHWDRRWVRHLNVKSGSSRHIVRFVEVEGRRFAIKETSETSAVKELESYTRLHMMSIPSLIPIGTVMRDDGVVSVATRIGTQHQKRRTGYLITGLMEKVLPDSFLFRRAFTRENRNRIWDAVIRLFVQLHANGVYWGDASLANMLVHFSTTILPEVGRRTQLQAVLADAETVEIRPSLSDGLRRADLEYFLESMLWNAADLRAGGGVRDPVVTEADREYLRRCYAEQFVVELEMRSFELMTHIDVDRLLGPFDVKGYGKLLLQHINEHKWYLSERRGEEQTLIAAAEDWYAQIFRPVCGIFTECGLPGTFPDRTASRMYVEIMEHKYLLSEKEHRDVGLVAALSDYAQTFARQESERRTFGDIIRRVTSYLRGTSHDGHPVPLS